MEGVTILHADKRIERPSWKEIAHSICAWLLILLGAAFVGLAAFYMPLHSEVSSESPLFGVLGLAQTLFAIGMLKEWGWAQSWMPYFCGVAILMILMRVSFFSTLSRQHHVYHFVPLALVSLVPLYALSLYLAFIFSED